MNRPVFDLSGRLICVADLFDPVAGMVVEYDGAEHRKIRRHARDVEREELCRQVGLEYCKVTALDMRDSAVVLDRFESVRRRALFLPAGRRQWTLDYPPGWRHTESLDEKLARRMGVARQRALDRGRVAPGA